MSDVELEPPLELLEDYPRSPRATPAGFWAYGAGGHDGHRLPWWIRTGASVFALASATAAIAMWEVSRTSRKPLVEHRGNEAIELSLKGSLAKLGLVPEAATEIDPMCGRMEEGVDYEIASTWGYSLDHIPTASWCCAMCWANPKCKAWVWVQNAGLPGIPSQCWIKGSEPVGRKKKLGVISGLPPRRPEFTKVPPSFGPILSGSLFCFSLAMPTGYEISLLKWQFKKGASIFGCDDYDVFSNTSLQIAPGVALNVVESDLLAREDPESGRVFDSWVYLAVWQKVTESGVYRKHDWTVKVDPDVVFFPNRLRKALIKHEGAAYISNCELGLKGAIEVLSRRAVTALADDYQASFDKRIPRACVTGRKFGNEAESDFLDVCLGQQLHLTPVPVDSRLMCDQHCKCLDWYWCRTDAEKVTFRPFKTVEAYELCMAAAMEMEMLSDS